MPPLHQRRLISTCLESRRTYIETLHQYCLDHHIFERQLELQDDPTPWKAEAIDRDISQGMAAAENKC